MHQFHLLISCWVIFTHQLHCPTFLGHSTPLPAQQYSQLSVKYPSQHHKKIGCSIPFLPIQFKIFQLQFKSNFLIQIQLIFFHIFQLQFPLQLPNWIGIELINSNSFFNWPRPYVTVWKSVSVTSICDSSLTWAPLTDHPHKCMLTGVDYAVK